MTEPTVTASAIRVSASVSVAPADAGAPSPLAVVIPTLGRDEVLVRTVEELLAQRPLASELLVVDQTSCHKQETEDRLAELHKCGRIRWMRLPYASQPGACNAGLRAARSPLVLFLDDDIHLDPGFLRAHVQAFSSGGIWAVAGQVLQPRQAEDTDYRHIPETGPLADLRFPFNSARRCIIRNGMSGNLCVRREKALEVGGFDENFLPPVSYRFDSDFCKRLCSAGGQILFEPTARIYHLREPSGGTRSVGNHMASASPLHGQGDYYFALRRGVCFATLRYILCRPLREVRTRFHLSHPWWIPVKAVGELRALALAVSLFRRGARLVTCDRA